jgi:hypothetical protein
MKNEINIVYAPGGGPQKMYENDKGVIWNSNTYDPNKINVGMGWYSIKDPRPQDSILVVEPYCVLPRDYDVGFIKRFKHIFTWATKAMVHDRIVNKVVEINHPTYHNIPNLAELAPTWPSWEERDNEIVFIANNKSSKNHSELYSLRVALADMLDAFSSFKVSWYGQILLKRPYYRGKAENKDEILKRAKFSICTENSYDPLLSHNYFTEKMPDVWKTGAVPIYMGCFNIDDFGAVDRCYIDLRPYVEKHGQSWRIDKHALNDRITHFSSEQYKHYLDNIQAQVEQADLIGKYHSYRNVYEKIIDTISTD